MNRRRTGEGGIALIKSFEGLELNAYRCPAGVPTIGWGHTHNVRMGDRITIEMAEDYLRQDLRIWERSINKLVKVELNQHQFDSLVCFEHNVGEKAFSESTLLKVINNGGNDLQVCEQIRRWIYADGEISNGLKRRREAECKLWRGDV